MIGFIFMTHASKLIRTATLWATSAVAAAAALAMPATAANLDRDALIERGEVFVVALSDAFERSASDCREMGDRTCARYFTNRAGAIANGGELYNLPIRPDADLDAWMNGNPSFEYAETYALITSQAADVTPRAVARVQSAYEGWVLAMSSGDAHRASTWHTRWEGALATFTETPDEPSTGEQLLSAVQ